LTAPATTSQLAAQLGLTWAPSVAIWRCCARPGWSSGARIGRSVNYVATPVADALLSADASR
jgi:hypothetical protein